MGRQKTELSPAAIGQKKYACQGPVVAGTGTGKKGFENAAGDAVG